MRLLVGEHRDAEQCVCELASAPLDVLEIRRVVQSHARLKIQFADCRKAFGRLYGQRRLRPLARRRASVRRPPLVAMRALNPCVRARCRLLGLNVRFMARLEAKPWGKSKGWAIYERRQGYATPPTVSIDDLQTWS